MLTIEEKIVAITNEKLNRDRGVSIGDLDRSLKDLGIDSLDFMLILIGVQEALEIEIPDEETPSLTNLAKVVEYVKGAKR
jgi:acyl carrier protein